MKKYFGCLILAGAVAAVSAQTQIDLRKQARVVDFSSALSTRPFRTGPLLPVICSQGDTFFQTTAAPVIGVFLCTAPNTWLIIGPGGAPAITSFANALHDHQSAAGGSVLTSGAIGGSSKHGSGTAFQMFGGGNLLANDCAKFDAAGNLVSAGAPCGSGSGGAVTGVFGRIGAVAAQAGDYSFAQLSGTLLNAQIAAGIDAVKIGAGSVANTAFGYVANVTSDIQTQLNAKAASTHSHTLAGDVIGNIAASSVVRIQNRTLSPAAPSNGQVLTWNAASSNWEPQAPTGASGSNALQIQGRNVSPAAPADGQALVWTAAGSTWQPAAVSGAGSGASASGQLSDLQVALTSATALTVGAGCSALAPCNVRFGNTVYSIVTGATVNLTGSTAGTAYIYISPSGAITVGHNLNLACLNCTAVSSVISFPPDSIPIWTWTSSSGSWDPTGGRDRRAFLAAKPILSGTGIVTTDSGGETTVALDTAVVNTYASGAASPTGPCSIGQVFFRSNNTFYVCASASTWTLLGPGGGSGNVTNASGAGPPAGTCSTGTDWYLDTTNQDAWFCSATNSWKKVISTANSGSYLAAGQTGATPSTPAAGLLREYFDSTAKVPQAVDDAGVKSTMVRPSTAPAGQFATGVSALGVVTYATPAGGGSGCYFTASQACVEDEFLSGTFSSGTIGSLGWNISAVGSGQIYASINGPFAGHPGTIELQAFSGTDDIAMALKPSAATSLHLFSETWQMTWIFHQENVDGTAPTGMTSRVGSVDLTAPSGSPQNGCSGSANGVWIESLAADTDYFLVSCAAGVADTRVDTGVAKGTGWPKAVIKRVDATTVGVSMNGGAVNCITSSGTAPAACTGTNLVSATHLPAGTVKQNPFAFLIPTASAEKHLTIDYFQLLVTGLTR